MNLVTLYRFQYQSLLNDLCLLQNLLKYKKGSPAKSCKIKIALFLADRQRYCAYPSKYSKMHHAQLAVRGVLSQNPL